MEGKDGEKGGRGKKKKCEEFHMAMWRASKVIECPDGADKKKM